MDGSALPLPTVTDGNQAMVPDDARCLVNERADRGRPSFVSESSHRPTDRPIERGHVTAVADGDVDHDGECTCR